MNEEYVAKLGEGVKLRNGDGEVLFVFGALVAMGEILIYDADGVGEPVSESIEAVAE